MGRYKKSKKILNQDTMETDKEISQRNAMFKLSVEYLNKLDKIDTIRAKKYGFAKEQDYECAAIERNNESIAVAEADLILSKMRQVKNRE